MFRRGRYLIAAGALALGLGFWGCEQAVEPAGPAMQADGPAANGLLGLIDDVSTEDLPVPDPLGAEALADLPGVRSVQGTVKTVSDKLVSAVLGLEGGRLELAGHQLTVPAGAVLAPTRFTMRLVPNGGVEVDLRAVQAGAGNIGSSGFEIPVQLALSYVDTDVDDPGSLVIVRVGTGERLDTRHDEAGARVWAELDHFSRYRLCSN